MDTQEIQLLVVTDNDVRVFEVISKFNKDRKLNIAFRIDRKQLAFELDRIFGDHRTDSAKDFPFIGDGVTHWIENRYDRRTGMVMILPYSPNSGLGTKKEFERYEQVHAPDLLIDLLGARASGKFGMNPLLSHLNSCQASFSN